MATSSEQKQSTPTFFKLLLDPSAPHLPLPPSFVKRYLKETISKNPIFKLVTEEHSWRLKIKEINGKYCFANGWKKVVKDADLGFGDFLVFWLIDESTFEASVYGPSGCEKDVSSNFTNACNCKRSSNEIRIEDEDEDEDEDEVEEVEDVENKKGCSVDSSDGHPSFQKIISSKTHNFIMRLPKEFVMETEIGNRRSMVVKDLQGREWSMKIHFEAGYGRHYLSKGWPIFKDHSKLSDGDICLFKFMKKEGILTLAQVIKNKGKLTPRAERKTWKRKRNVAPIEALRVYIKSEDESTPAAEKVKRKRGRPVKRKRGRPSLTKSPN